MKAYHQTAFGTLYHGDCLEIMKQLPENSVDTCITSPPYWGLRDYGVDGQLGLEKTPEEYVANMVQLFREVKRVMKADGVLWLNLGDSYAGSGHGYLSEPRGKQATNHGTDFMCSLPPAVVPDGLKSKDLVGIPWRVAFALQADGWWLRQDIIWHKPNPMPESVTDRCTKSHEYIFMLTKSAKYYYDNEAVKEVAKRDWNKSGGNIVGKGVHKRNDGYVDNGDGRDTSEVKEYRNKRSVWTVATKPYKEAHFATYPPELITPCVLTSKPGAVILDPFFGAGTTGVVAIRNRRKYIGCELNPEYCEIAARRIDSELQQTEIEL